MPRPRSAMRKIREVLRLSLAEGLSPRQVSASLGVPRITVRRFVERAKLAGLSWPLPEGMDDQALEQRLFGPPPPPSVTRPLRCRRDDLALGPPSEVRGRAESEVGHGQFVGG